MLCLSKSTGCHKEPQVKYEIKITENFQIFIFNKTDGQIFLLLFLLCMLFNEGPEILFNISSYSMIFTKSNFY